MTLVEDNWFVRELELEIHRCYSSAAEALCERLFKRRFAQGLAYLLTYFKRKLRECSFWTQTGHSLTLEKQFLVHVSVNLTHDGLVKSKTGAYAYVGHVKYAYHLTYHTVQI